MMIQKVYPVLHFLWSFFKPPDHCQNILVTMLNKRVACRHVCTVQATTIELVLFAYISKVEGEMWDRCVSVTLNLPAADDSGLV